MVRWLSIALILPLGAIGRLGGRATCWDYFHNYEACCDLSMWGTRGNPSCFDTRKSRDACCRPLPSPGTCVEHYVQLKSDKQNSAYPLGRALEVLTCFALGKQQRWTRLALERAVNIAGSLPGEAQQRALAVIALEYHRASQTSFSDAFVEVGAIHGELLATNVFGALSPQTAENCGQGGCMTPLGKELRQCASTRRLYPRIRGAWSAWGHDGSTRIGRTLWCLCAREDVGTVLDLGAHVGSGSALTAAHSLNQTGGMIFAFEFDQKHLPRLYANMLGYEGNTRIIEKDANLALPELCTFLRNKRKPIDVVILDVYAMETDSRWRLIRTLLQFCAPRYWVISNVQIVTTSDVVEHLLSNGHRLELHDLSPTLASLIHQIQEFVIVSKSPPQSIA